MAAQPPGSRRGYSGRNISHKAGIMAGPVPYGACGDFDTARLIHFCAMSAIVLFVLVHVTMTFVAPRTLLAMVRGR
jgi:thiosulfate reductase cytochrome b subunit